MSDATPDTVSPGPVSRDQIWASAVAVAANSVEQLRRCDVDRVVSLVDAADRTALTGWLIARWPDLAGAVAEALSALAQEAYA
ncbi:hypothetical protein NKW55_13825 [Gluconobacter kondonii]|uniref:hypothetical protein n=1 Tax=Gluconobacter kondonii TaxID=941463 RepID=UPI00209DD426|nr:hypothetical protein [Gluconobacter kondonii]MCP1237664.1 hypothetical protein [Gluconobacter kondonii]